LRRHAGNRRGRAGGPAGTAPLAAGSAPATLSQIIAALYEQNTAEEKLFAAVVGRCSARGEGGVTDTPPEHDELLRRGVDWRA
jgi:hypothetical protein